MTARTCDELPWLLWKTESRDRLRACLLDMKRFLLIQERDQDELMGYWVWLGEEREMGEIYLESFETWSREPGRQDTEIASSANHLAFFLFHASLYAEAEPLWRRALAIFERSFGANPPKVATALNNLAALLTGHQPARGGRTAHAPRP